MTAQQLKDLLQSLERGDIFVCLRELSRLITTESSEDESISELHWRAIAKQVGLVVSRYCSTFIPVEYAEIILTSTARLLESRGGQLVQYFSTTAEFIAALIMVVKDSSSLMFMRAEDEENKRMSESAIQSSSSYLSHYCYELALYTILGLIERSKLLINVINTIKKSEVMSLISTISRIIPIDELYLTQEMGLEIIARFSHYLVTHDVDFLREALKGLNSDVTANLLDGTSRIVALLRDMRGPLNAINQLNCHIQSITIKRFSVQSFPRGIHTQTLTDQTWLDLCENCVCFHVNQAQQFVRFEYATIAQFTFDESGATFTFLLEKPPARLIEVFNLQNIDDQEAGVQIAFELDDEKSLIGAASFVQSRIDRREVVAPITELSNVKVSVATMKHLNKGKVAVDHSQPVGLGKAARAISDASDEQTKEASISSVSSPDMLVDESQAKLAETKAIRRLKSNQRDSLAKVTLETSQAKKKYSKRGDRGRKRQASPTKKPADTQWKKAKSTGPIETDSKPSKAARMRTIPSESLIVTKAAGQKQEKESRHFTRQSSQPKENVKNASSVDIMLVQEEQLSTEVKQDSFNIADAMEQDWSRYLDDSKIPHQDDQLTLPAGGETTMEDHLETIAMVKMDHLVHYNSSPRTKVKKAEPAPAILEKVVSAVERPQTKAARIHPQHSVSSTPLPSSFPPSQTKEELLTLIADQYDYRASPDVEAIGTFDTDEDSILSSLIKEIAKLQQERAQRKKTKLLMGICYEAKEQLSDFVSDWKKYCDQVTSERQSALKLQLEAISRALRAKFPALESQIAAQEEALREIDGTLVVLKTNTTIYQSEGEHLLMQLTDDLATARSEIKRVRLEAVGRAKGMLSKSENKANIATKSTKLLTTLQL